MSPIGSCRWWAMHARTEAKGQPPTSHVYRVAARLGRPSQTNLHQAHTPPLTVPLPSRVVAVRHCCCVTLSPKSDSLALKPRGSWGLGDSSTLLVDLQVR